jgi:predicted RNA-binding protein with PUA-like domain
MRATGQRSDAQTKRAVEPRRWVFLADPKAYGWNDLIEDGATLWDGIRNAQAQRSLRACEVSDIVLLYHTAPDKALVGTARITAPPEPDPADDARVAVRIAPVAPLARPLPLAELRDDAVLAAASFVRMPRVAIHPLDAAVWDRVMTLTGTDPGVAGDVDPTTVGGP